MKRVKLNLFVLMLLFACMHLGGENINITTKASQNVNNTAIILIHGCPGQGADAERNIEDEEVPVEDSPWGMLPDYLEEYLEGDFWTGENVGDAKRLFVYVDGFDDKEETYVTGGHAIGNDPDKWINRVRKLWHQKYEDKVSPLLTTPYPENIILITHSAGGLVARAYLTDENNWRKEGSNPVLDVSQIITAQSPNTGVDIAPCQSFSSAAAFIIAGSVLIAIGNVPLGTAYLAAGGILTIVAIASTIYSLLASKNLADFSYYSPDLTKLNNKDLTYEMRKVKWGNIYIDDVICTLSTALRPPTQKTGNDFIEFVFYIIGLISPVGFGDTFVPASSQRGFTWENKLNYIENGKNYRITAGGLDIGAHFRKNNFNNFKKWDYFLNDWSSKSINKGTMQNSDFMLMDPGGSTKPGLLMEMPSEATTGNTIDNEPQPLTKGLDKQLTTAPFQSAGYTMNNYQKVRSEEKEVRSTEYGVMTK
jgi:hypothetical protein